MSRGAAEPALPRPGADGAPCHACQAPLAADQRYCLECGARRGGGGPIDFAYVTPRNPFVYFHAIAESPTCASAVVDLAELDADLAAPAEAQPAFS